MLLVDGCGVLHPRRCGSASHLGVAAGAVTVGVAKSLLEVDGLDRRVVAQQLRQAEGADESSSAADDGDAAPPPSAAAVGAGDSDVDSRRGRSGADAASSTPAALQQALDGAPPLHAPAVGGGGRVVWLVGRSGARLGAALCTAGSSKPLFVSTGALDGGWRGGDWLPCWGTSRRQCSCCHSLAELVQGLD